MFANNRKISARQLQWLVILGSIGKAGLLLPRYTGNESGRSFILSLILGALLTLLFVFLIGSLAQHIQNDFHAYIQNRLGEKAAFVISIVYLVYVFVDLIYVTWLFSSVSLTFLLPEKSYIFSMIILLAGGCYMAAGGMEVQGRVAEVLHKIIIYPLFLMLLLAAFAVNPEYLGSGAAQLNIQTLKHGFQMLIPFGSISLFLFIAPFVNSKKSFKIALRRAAGIIAVSMIGLFLIVIGVFGEAGMRALPWPAITLMSSVDIPGGFLQRWDVIFTGLLMLCFFVAAGMGLFCMKFLENELLNGKGKSWYLAVSALVVLAAAVWVGSYETAVKIYTIVNGYILLPIIAVFIFLLLYLEWVKRRKEK